jgi:hypothetical protein
VVKESSIASNPVQTFKIVKADYAAGRVFPKPVKQFKPEGAQRGLRPQPNNKELLNAKGAKNAKKKRAIFKRGAGVSPAFFA